MKFITLFGLLLVVLDLSEEIEYTPVCPDSKVKTYHEALLPNSDFYVCEDGFVTDFIKCDYEDFTPESKCGSDDPCCEKFSREYEIIPKQISGRKKRNVTPQPMFTKENILFVKDLLKKDYEHYVKQIVENASLSTDGTKIVPEDDSQIEIPKFVDTKSTPNIDTITVPSPESITDELSTASEFPANILKSSEKFKRFTRELVIPVIEDVVNYHSKMSLVAGLCRKYMYTVVPLFTDVMQQLEAHPGSSIKLPRKQITDAMNKVQETKQLFQKVSLEIMPSIFHKIGGNMKLVIDAMEEIEERFQIDFLGLPFKYLFLCLDCRRIKESSSDEFITFQPTPEVRRDIKIFSKIVADVTEITSDHMFSKKFNLVTLLIRLFFFFL